MDSYFFETSQMLNEHPIKLESESYKIKYLHVLDYFVRKFSSDDIWANSVLQLYIKKLLSNSANYANMRFDFQKDCKSVVATKFKPFKFYTFRFCLLMDCIFMNAYRDRIKGEKILNEISSIYPKWDQDKIHRLFCFLYNPCVPIDDISNVDYQKTCWNQNMAFQDESPLNILITANMSAGKSTLLNAIVGRKVNRTQSDACTSKIHYIINKPFEDFLCYEWDYLLNLDADYKTLMEDDARNLSPAITVGIHFRNLRKDVKRVKFIDTPGVNFSQKKIHRQITEESILSSNADLLIYLLNGENVGTDDDRNHLLFVAEHFHGRLLFVVNKVDRFKKNEDSVTETIQNITKELIELGFVNPFVVPVSSYAAYLAKMKLFGEPLNEDEQDEFDRLVRKLGKTEYQFDTYYPKEIQNATSLPNESDEALLLMHSGILQLEQIIYTMR